MDPNSNTGTRKVRFIPRGGPRRVPKPAAVKKEAADVESDQAKELLRRFSESSSVGRAKVERKPTPSKVTFGAGASSSSIKSYGAHRSGINYQGPGASASGSRAEKEYQEPWDYYSNYPVTLPLRRPYSGDPELLDEEEFGDAAQDTVYNENSINSAKELGLMEENQEKNLVFFQLPSVMPTTKRSATSDGTNSNSKTPNIAARAERPCKFEELPAGHMGKLLVYKSGKVKLKLGDILYDVSPGVDCSFAQDVVAINAKDKDFCVLGELNKRAVVVPDIDSLLDGI